MNESPLQPKPRPRLDPRSDPQLDPQSNPGVKDVRHFREMLQAIDERWDRQAKRRLRKILTLGVAFSLLIHIGIMIYLSLMYRAAPAGPGTEPVWVDFSFLPEELPDRIAEEMDDLISEDISDLEDTAKDDPAPQLEATIPAADLEVVSVGAAPQLGGGAGTEGMGGLGGGGGGATFFGISSKGTRFAYIVDRSGSMLGEDRMEVAKDELKKSIEGLPDYAYFHVLFYSSRVLESPSQRGWKPARHRSVRSFLRWLSGVDAQGGTQPLSAFKMVFELDPQPEVIYFLTDGEIPPGTAGMVRQFNEKGRKAVIHTIAFGDPTSQDQLKDIASASGGIYRFVSGRRP